MPLPFSRFDFLSRKTRARLIAAAVVVITAEKNVT
jgi:hypothetical protein